MDKKEKILELLAYALNNARIHPTSGFECVGLLELYYNECADAKHMSEELLSRLDANGRRHFHDLWALCGLSLVFSYIKGDKYPVDPQEFELMEYAYEHKEQFCVEFSSYTRVYVDFDDCTAKTLSSMSFKEWLLGQNRDYFGYTVNLLAAAERIEHIHPATKSSFFVGVWAIRQDVCVFMN